MKTTMPASFSTLRTRTVFAFGLGLILSLSAVGLAAAQEKVIFTFDYANGEEPVAGLLADSSGNLVGSAKGGGAHGKGEVFELAKETNGSWSPKTVYAFQNVVNDIVDAGIPESALIRDAKGNLYGTTYGGGQHGRGTVYELTKKSDGSWTETILYNFGHTLNDAQDPIGEVVRDSKGDLYGTTYLGGKYDGGTVFKLTPKATGEWTEVILHHFKPGADGYSPRGRLSMDAKGRLYGATFFGGENGAGPGTVFQLTPKENGEWTEKIIYSAGEAGAPQLISGGVIIDAKGNVYGTSGSGGESQGQSCSCGTVFELLPNANGSFHLKILHAFVLAKTDGELPQSSLTFDNKGNLYGTTQRGGAYAGGTVFKLTPGAGGKWTETLLASFGKNRADGSSPVAGVALDTAGNVYGVTMTGGRDNEGTVFEVPHPKAAETPETDPDEPEAQER